MRARGAALLAISFAAACAPGCAPGGEPIAEADLLLRISTNAGEVELGKAFPLTVVRVWEKSLVPEAWSDDVLSPLAVRLVSSSRREDDRRVEETRRYAAYAFSLDEVTVPAPTFHATPRGADSANARSVPGDRVALRVRRALDPAARGAPELPGEPIAEPFPWRAWTIGACAAIAAFVSFRVRRLRAARLAAAKPSAVAPAAPPPPGPHEIALGRIERLRASAPRTDEDVVVWHVEASALLRAFVSARFGLRATEMTSEEIVTAAPESAHRRRLADALRDCDLAKFAKRRPQDAERAATLVAAEEFLRGDAVGLAAAGGAR